MDSENPQSNGKNDHLAADSFFALNILMSGIAMFRWSRRIEGIEPSNVFWEWVDERFPNERMEKVYANMKFTNKSEE